MSALGRDGIFLFEGFRLDRTAGELFRRREDGAFEPMAIGSRALDVLGVLLERAGDLVSRHEFMAAVWPATAVEDINLNMQIAALRRVLDSGRAYGSCIQTIPGRGYRLAVPVRRVEAKAHWNAAAVPHGEPSTRRGTEPIETEPRMPRPAADPTIVPSARDEAERRQITALACELIVPSGETDRNLEDLREAVGAVGAAFRKPRLATTHASLALSAIRCWFSSAIRQRMKMTRSKRSARVLNYVRQPRP